MRPAAASRPSRTFRSTVRVDRWVALCALHTAGHRRCTAVYAAHRGAAGAVMTFTVAVEPGFYTGWLRAHAVSTAGPQRRALCGWSTTGMTILADMPWESTHRHARCLHCDRDVGMRCRAAKDDRA